MSEERFVTMKRRLRDNLAWLALWHTKDMIREARKHRAACRRKSGTVRLIKEFRALKSLLLADERLHAGLDRDRKLRRLDAARRRPENRRP